MRRALLVAALAGCSYSPQAGSADATLDDAPESDGQQAGGALVPSNVTDTSPLDAPNLPDLDMANLSGTGSTVWRIYTNTGLIQREDGAGFVTHRAEGLGIDPTTGIQIEVADAFTIVMFVDELSVRQDVSFEGHGDRALIVVAKSAITIAGEIDFSGGFAVPGSPTSDFLFGGPGGGDGALNSAIDGNDLPSQGCGGQGVGGRSAGSQTPGDDSGGGGGGGAFVGGEGGDKSDPSDVGGAAGQPCLTVALVPLRGGSGGGSGNIVGGGGGNGGGGGGAIQLSSLVRVSVVGTIDAGGKGGFAQALNDDGGGGGGSGGGILLEAPIVEVSGVLAANGGGGGSGREPNDGGNGTRTMQPALGGLGSGGDNADGRGGDGGAGALAAQAGDSHDPGGGGGGGSVGVVRINTATDGLTIDSNAVISPAHTAGPIVLATPRARRRSHRGP